MAMVPTASTMNSTAASIRSFVRRVSGRKAAKTSAFHTQSHLSHAESWNCAVSVVMPHQASRTTIIPCRAEKREPSLRSSSSQPAKAAMKAISDSGTDWIKPQPIFCGTTMSM